MIIEFASEVSNLAWRVSQSQNGGAIFARTKWSPMFGSVVFDYQWCILIVMSVKSSFYNEYDIKNNEKPVFWAQRSFQNHHQTFHDRCPEKIGPLPKKSDDWSTRTCPENIRPAPTWWQGWSNNMNMQVSVVMCDSPYMAGSFLHLNQSATSLGNPQRHWHQTGKKIEKIIDSLN